MTPGKVVFQNDLIQLIQYSPSTEEVYRAAPAHRAAMDQQVSTSSISCRRRASSNGRWRKGFTVFIVSWVNPDAKLAQKTFEDYMHEGILAAVDAVTKQTGQKQINALGYCVGGTLLASTLAYMAAKKRQPHRLGELPRRASRFQRGRRPARLHRRRAVELARRDDGRARLSRRLAHGGGVQHAAARAT